MDPDQQRGGGGGTGSDLRQGAPGGRDVVPFRRDSLDAGGGLSSAGRNEGDCAGGLGLRGALRRAAGSAGRWRA